MKKQSDRIKIWREKQKAEGKSSITVLLSLEARTILTEEKEKTGESYSVIVERALRAQNKKSYRLPTQKQSRQDKILANVSTGYQQPVIPVPIKENAGKPKPLIDDLVHYPSVKDIELEQALKKMRGGSDTNLKKGLFNKLFRISRGSKSRRKKWFQ
ncbi:MAG: hypothetical protein PHN98_02350 [Smithellaceae bacterium]|nr:hypothetical protein [Smithellaceae bacterium]